MRKIYTQKFSMANDVLIDELKNLLRHEVALFCQHDQRKWKSEIWKTVSEIRSNNWPAVFFGGTLRSLLVSRIARNKIGRPRDIDIVLSGIRVHDIKVQFERYVSRETRFGGVQLVRKNWQLDLWPLDKTYAFHNGGSEPQFPDLPKTTFLNLEAVAIDVWPQSGKPRAIYSGDDQFFRGILTRTIELNNEDNPFPQLCVARALVIASDLQWKVGPKLIKYIRNHSEALSGSDFEEVQRKHYGAIRLRASAFERVREFLHEIRHRPDDTVELPLPKQLNLWCDENQDPRFRFTIVNRATKLISKPRFG